MNLEKTERIIDAITLSLMTVPVQTWTELDNHTMIEVGLRIPINAFKRAEELFEGVKPEPFLDLLEGCLRRLVVLGLATEAVRFGGRSNQ